MAGLGSEAADRLCELNVIEQVVNVCQTTDCPRRLGAWRGIGGPRVDLQPEGRPPAGLEYDSHGFARYRHRLSLSDFFVPLSRAGLGIAACRLMHINPDYVRQGPADPQKFFVTQDVTAQAHELFHGIEDKVSDQFMVIRQPECPEILIGPHCDDPYECPLHDQCWSYLPTDNVLTLYRGGKKGFKLLADGIFGIKDIPDGFPLTENQEIQRRVAVSGKPHVSKTAIRAFLGQLECPVSYLDFETFGTAIPLFDRTRPYEQVPFQFSLHVVGSPGSQPEHHMFLADGRVDPRPDFLQRLRDWLPDAGSIVVYNAHSSWAG